MSSESDPATQHPCDLPIATLLTSCQVTRTRGSGPGGQHRNKVETAIVVKHEPSGIVGQASEKRSQQANKEAAVARLRVNLALEIRTERQNCSNRWNLRTQQGKLQVNIKHFDYAAILAEAIDFVWQHEFDVAATAKQVGTSTSQLIKFLKTSPAAFAAINRYRQQQNMKALK
ncbi:peptide chain release factor-like protein [Mariniblastus sp.]|nr:peptide chain release factor-like protein [Mariniblastus sp.]